MRRAVGVSVASGVAAASLAACTLLVDTSNLEGPADAQSDAASIVDAGRDTAGPLEGGGDSDSPTGQPILLAQSAGGYTNGFAYSQGFPLPNTEGNTIVVYAFGNGAGSLSVADSRGNTYQSIPQIASPLSGSVAQIFFAQRIAGGANTLTLTKGGASTSDGGIAIFEYSGLATTGPLLDGYAGQFAPAASAKAATPPVTTTFANDLLFAAFCNVVGGGDIIADPGWNPRYRNTNFYLLTEDRVVSSAGSYKADATMPRADANWVAVIAAFRGAP